MPDKLGVGIIVDNYAPDKHLRVKRWLAARSRFQARVAPIYASCLIEVEMWFNRITQQAIGAEPRRAFGK